MTLGRHVYIVWQHSFRFDTLKLIFLYRKCTGLPFDKKLSINVTCLIKIRSGNKTEWANCIYSIASFVIFTFSTPFVVFLFQQMYIFCWHLYLPHREQNVNASSRTRVSLFFFFSAGPRAYAPDAPQPVGLLCYPSVSDVPTFAASPAPRPCYPRDP
jgi:hypothetical protein